MKTKYKLLTKKENEQAIIQILNVLLDKSLPYSGAHRRAQWEKGWAENNPGNITPKYFGKHKINRLNGKLVWGLSKDYEVKMLYSLVDALAIKYLRGLYNVYEFGCGTGHNLLRIQAVSPRSILHGFDWTHSSNELVRAMGFHAENFDYFNPPEVNLRPDSGVYTVASLEQIGTKYKKFVDYLLKQKPRIVVHIEPIPELLDPTKLLDYLSIQYMHKRHYLNGYLDYLRELEKKGKIVIHEARRSGIGSFLIDGYSIISWSPK